MENNDLYKTNCADKAKLYVLCMKKPNTTFPVENKCKYLFDSWYNCILDDNYNKNKINIK